MRGQSVSTAPKGNEWLYSANPTPLTATGNSQGTALAIPLGQDLSVFGTVAASTGTILPPGIGTSEEYAVANHGANALSVYPPTGGKMGSAATNAAYSLASGKTGYFICVGPNQFTVCP